MSLDRETQDREAARWRARLGADDVTTAEANAFEAWRASPGAAEAWARLEAIWAQAGALADDPELRAARKSARRRRARAAAGAIFVRFGAASLVGVVALVAVALLVPRPIVHETGVGTRRTVVLADGSRLTLDTDTRAEVRFRNDARDVRLVRGRALFDVRPEPARPFSVVAGTARATALGTRFVVRVDADGAAVAVLSGRVAVERRDASSGLAPLRSGEGVHVPVRAEAVVRPVSAAADEVLAWTQGRLVFRRAPLGDAVREANRYWTGDVRLADDDLRTMPVSGVFIAGDRAAFVAAVTESFSLRAVPEADGGVRLLPLQDEIKSSRRSE